MTTIGIIPARYHSSRLPGKPLLDILGKSMIQRVYEQAKESIIDELIVATDDQRIEAEVMAFGGQVMMTSQKHKSGTDRCLEVLENINKKFDLVVNIFTNLGFNKRQLTVFGDNQLRPNIHIKDMVNVYKHFLKNKDIPSGCYNAGFENISILDIANEVSKLIDTEIVVTESNDPRSYRLDSSKILQTGFRPEYSVLDAIKEIISLYKQNKIRPNDSNYTVRWMRKKNYK